MPLQLLEAWPQLELSEITTAINVGQAARQIGLSPASLEIPVRRTQNTGLRKGLEDQLLLLYSLGRLIEASPPLRNSIEKQGIQESTALIIEAINTLLFLSTQAQRNIRTTLKAEEKGSSPRLHPLRIIELLIDAAKVAGETKDPRELNDPIALAFILQRMIKEQADSETNQPDFLAAA